MVVGNKKVQKLTETQSKVLDYLIPGLATDRELYEKVLNDVKIKPESSRRKALKIINDLIEIAYIDLRNMPKSEERIVIATSKGVAKVIGHFRYFTLETAWKHFPKRDHETHDLMYASVMRKILAAFDPAEIIYVRPEHYLRKLAGKSWSQSDRRRSYPDCEFAFFYHGRHCVDIEIVRGDMEGQSLLGKIQSSGHQNHFLAIVRDEKQIGNFYDYIVQSERKCSITTARAKMVHFISETELMTGKFQDLLWLTPINGKRLPLKDFRIRTNQVAVMGKFIDIPDDDDYACDFLEPL